MTALDASYLVYAVLAASLVAIGVRSVHRYSAPLVMDLVGSHEMAVPALHRLVTVGYALLFGALALLRVPDAYDVHRGAASATIGALAGLLLLMALGQLALVGLYLRSRVPRGAVESSRRHPRHVLIPGATPPTVPLYAPVFGPSSAQPVPPARPTPPAASQPTWTWPPPGGPQVAPPYPPPWCSSAAAADDVWAPPQR